MTNRAMMIAKTLNPASIGIEISQPKSPRRTGQPDLRDGSDLPPRPAKSHQAARAIPRF
jgi:hypothetical protein